MFGDFISLHGDACNSVHQDSVIESLLLLLSTNDCVDLLAVSVLINIAASRERFSKVIILQSDIMYRALNWNWYRVARPLGMHWFNPARILVCLPKALSNWRSFASMQWKWHEDFFPIQRSFEELFTHFCRTDSTTCLRYIIRDLNHVEKLQIPATQVICDQEISPLKHFSAFRTLPYFSSNFV